MNLRTLRYWLLNLHHTPRWHVAQFLSWLAHRICWMGAWYQADDEDKRMFPNMAEERTHA